jgi:hypothetical protein
MSGSPTFSTEDDSVLDLYERGEIGFDELEQRLRGFVPVRWVSIEEVNDAWHTDL